jgi:hypothetical protein
MSDRGITSQDPLFDVAPAWAEHWVDMPEFVQHENRPHDSINVYFATEDDRREFLKLVGADPHRQRGIWYPPKTRRRYDEERTVELRPGRYPVYVISKGRAETRLTSKALERLGLPYRIVVEPQEVDAYAAHIDRDKILALPFSNLGQGSIPARNFCWEHSLAEGHRRHWVLDDNLRNFARLNRNENRIVVNENPFAPCEEFVDRYTNVALAGMQYRGFASDKDPLPPYRLNTRIYSCILIDNALPFRWRGRYNEDTDLSLRALKAGYCTVLFNAYLIDKVATMTMGGGNTDELYADDGRLQMAESLREQHPDCVTITEKWGRPQHHVDYTPFRHNTLAAVDNRPRQLPTSMHLPIRREEAA